jgi:PAS domain S-box-containing protein
MCSLSFADARRIIRALTFRVSFGKGSLVSWSIDRDRTMLNSNPLLWPRPPMLVRYVIAVLSVGTALIIGQLPALHLQAAPVSLFLCAVMFSAWFGGVGPGLLAVLLSVLTFDYYVLPPIDTLALKTDELPRLVIFALSALFVGALSAAQRSAAESLRRGRDDLEIAGRELKRINEALRTENTGRKQAEEALRERASLLDLTHDTVFVRDMSDVITYWNRGAQELYGWSREEALGKVSHQLTQTIFPTPLEEINAELLLTGRWEGELIHAKRDGTQGMVASRWSLQRDEQGLPAAILETNNDVTERKRSEEALQNAQRELTHISRVTTLGEMTASIAHEINQPLAAVVTNGSACLRWLMNETPNLEEAREASRRVIRDGNRASQVIARIRALLQKTETQKAQLDINEAIQEIVLLTQHEAVRKGVRLRLELAPNLPPVFGDRVQLQQVALNLVMNGVEAMGAVNDRP